MNDIKYSDIFGDGIFAVKYLGIWDDNTYGYCPYGKEGGPIAHYEVRFVKCNYEIPKEYWMRFYDDGYAHELGRKLKGRSHELTIYAIHKPEVDAKVKCWEALKEYLRLYAFDERIKIRDANGLNWETDWYIHVDYTEAERYIKKKIDEVRKEKIIIV